MICPVRGSKYNLSEQRELDVINRNLFRRDGIWYTEYPWCCATSVLSRNDKLVFQNLLNLERMLEKNARLAYRQIEDIVETEAAIILSEHT